MPEVSILVQRAARRAVRKRRAAVRATADYSRGMRPSGTAPRRIPAPRASALASRVGTLRAGAFALAAAGAALLLAASAATVVSVRIGGATDPVLATGTVGSSGWERHGPALVLLALAALPLALLALRGSRAAALAVGAVGLTALLVALVGDLPAIRDEAGVREVYADSDVGAGLGWHLETAGSIALLLSAGIGLMLRQPPAASGAGSGSRPRHRRGADGEHRGLARTQPRA